MILFTPSRAQSTAPFKRDLHDHVLIYSISHGHPLHSSCKKFLRFCYNCTFFTTNTYPKLHKMTLYTARVSAEDHLSPPIMPNISNTPTNTQ